MHPRHPPRAFPLGLLAPRCLGAVLLLALPACGRVLGHRSIWGEEGILSPARAPPRSFGVRPSHNPSPHFHLCVYLVASAFRLSAFDWGGVRPSAWTLLAETARGEMQMLAPSPLEDERTPPTRARMQDSLSIQIFVYATPAPVL